jgi:CRP/FNR family transcriptional regulator
MQLDPAAFLASHELLEVLCQHATPVDCRQQQLFHQGEAPTGVYLLHEGEVEMSLDSEDGTRILTSNAQPGSLLGLPGLIGNRAYSLTATARPGSKISFLSGEDFRALMISDPMLSIKILQILAAEVRTARQAISLS